MIWSWWQFSFRFSEPNGIPFGSKSKWKLSSWSYPIQCEREWKYSFFSAEVSRFNFWHKPSTVGIRHSVDQSRKRRVQKNYWYSRKLKLFRMHNYKDGRMESFSNSRINMMFGMEILEWRFCSLFLLPYFDNVSLLDMVVGSIGVMGWHSLRTVKCSQDSSSCCLMESTQNKKMYY